VTRLGVERFNTYHIGTAETRRLFQYNYAHDREGSSHSNLPREIRLPSRIREVHPWQDPRPSGPSLASAPRGCWHVKSAAPKNETSKNSTSLVLPWHQYHLIKSVSRSKTKPCKLQCHLHTRAREQKHHLSDTRAAVCPYRVLATHPTGLNTEGNIL
jgi:hypothetical protein